MNVQIAELLLGIRDCDFRAISRQSAGIALLPAGFAIERRLVRNNFNLGALSGFTDFGTVNHQRNDRAVRGFRGVAQKFRCTHAVANIEPDAFIRCGTRSGPALPPLRAAVPLQR